MAASSSQRHYTLQDYLDVEAMGVVRHELHDGQIFAMAGGTPEHAALAAAMGTLLGERLRGTSCRPYSADLRIRVAATGLATYADASVICGPPARDPASPTHVTNPSIVVEVLSPGTAEYDRGEKRAHYLTLPSLAAYVLVAQDRRCVEVFSRDDAVEGGWRVELLLSGASVSLPAIGVSFAVDELYALAGLAVA